MKSNSETDCFESVGLQVRFCPTETQYAFKKRIPMIMLLKKSIMYVKKIRIYNTINPFEAYKFQVLKYNIILF